MRRDARPSGVPPLAPNEVHVWRVVVAEPKLGRACLAGLAADYLGARRADVAVVRDGSGRPRLRLAGRPTRLDVSLSRAEETTLIAVSAAGPVGVDVERLDERFEVDVAALAALTGREFTTWSRTRRADRAASFAWAWVQKEAYLKALGVGLARGPRTVEVEPGIDRPARLRRDALDGAAHRRWRLQAVPGIAGCVAAICARRSARLRCFLR